MAKVYTEEEINNTVGQIDGWAYEDGCIARVFLFNDFVQAMVFVNKAAEIAEASQHHPDIDIRYNRVKMALVSHDAGGVTDKDFQMAKTLNGLL